MGPKFYLAWYEKRGIMSLVDNIDFMNDVATLSYIDERTQQEKYIEVAMDDLEWFEEAKTADINGDPLFDGMLVSSDVLPSGGGVIIYGEIPFMNEDGEESFYDGFALLTDDEPGAESKEAVDIILPLSTQLVEKYNLEGLTHIKIAEMMEE